jgi:hypothetical protein
VAVNCWVWEAVRVAERGVSEMLNGGGLSASAALADLVRFATLLVFTVTVCAVGMVAGAVKRPAAEIVPTCGLGGQTTSILAAFAAIARGGVSTPRSVPVAANCMVFEAPTEVEAGDAGVLSIDPRDRLEIGVCPDAIP